MDTVRLDKWLWAVRVYKTRSQATEACRSGHVKIDGLSVKPAHEVRLNETVTVQLEHLTRILKVAGLLDKRVGGTAARKYLEDLTPPAAYDAAREAARQAHLLRPQGLGRPTKKDRRQISQWAASDGFDGGE